MAKNFSKGMNKDTSPLHQPEGTYRHAQNMVFNRLYGSLSTERGFEVQFNINEQLEVRNHLILGGVPTVDERLVLFAIDSADDVYNNTTASKIIVIYPDNYMEVILDDRQDPVDLNFDFEHMVSGESKKNYMTETVVYFTDDFNPPRRVNIDRIKNQSTLNQNDVDLFPQYLLPTLTEVNTEEGGNLTVGSYTFFFQYEDESGNRSDFFNISGSVPVVADKKAAGYRNYDGTPAKEESNQLINFTIENIDQRYKYLRIGTLSLIDGVKDAYVFRYYAISGDTLYGTFSGSEDREPVPLEELYQEKAHFERVKTMTTLNNQLWLGNVKYQQNIDFQPYANNIKVSWEYNTDDKNDYKPGKYDPVDVRMTQNLSYKRAGRVALEKTLMAGEVYALYIAPVFQNGQEDYAYHIPGRSAATIDYVTIPDTWQENDKLIDINNAGDLPSEMTEDLNIDGDIRYFHTRQTDSNSYNATTNMGYWENQNENYPNTESFVVRDQSGTQINDLRGQKVRHHKMPDYKPSYGDVDQTNYFYNPDLDKLQTIRILLDDIVVPDHLAPLIQGFKFYFAKRGQENYTVSGQTLIMPSTYNDPLHQKTYEGIDLPEYRGSPVPYPVEAANIASPGSVLLVHTTDSGGYIDHTGVPREKLVRTHAFDILATDDNRPRVDFLKTQQVWYSKLFDFDNGPGKHDLIKTHEVDTSNTQINLPANTSEGCLIHHDLTNPPETYTGPLRESFGDANPVEIAAVKPGSEKLLLNNRPYQETDNTGSETTYQLELTTGERYNKIFKGNSYQKNEFVTRFQYFPMSQEFYDYSERQDYFYASFYLVNLQRYQQDMYLRFDDQELIPFSDMLYTDGSKTYGEQKIRGGDVVVSDYSERNTSKFLTGYKTTEDDFNNGFPLWDDGGEVVDVYHYNLKVLYTYFCLTTLNANLRHTDDGDDSNYYPDLNNSTWDLKELIGRPLHESNAFKYNNDLTAINDNAAIDPYPLLNEFTHDAPSLVAGSEPDTWEKEYDPWQNFRVNDYKDFGRTNGKIWKIKGYDDRMIIHFESALFQTIGRSEVQTDTESAYIGGGGVLTSKAKQMLPGDHGQAGTRSQYAAVLTKYGYFFADATYGKVYMLGDGIKEISAKGMNNFFEQNLRPRIIDLMYQRYRGAGVKPPNDLYEKYDKPHSLQPVGLVAEFDEYNERILLTKHDIVPGESLDSAYLLQEDDYELLYHYGEGEWIIKLTQNLHENQGAGNYILNGMLVVLSKTKGGTTLSSTSTSYFYTPKLDVEFNSWTVSYNPQLDQWVSFHEYKPNLYLRQKDQLLSVYSSTPHLDRVWRHNMPTGTYYNWNGSKTDYVDIVVRGEGYDNNFLHSVLMFTQALEENGNERFDHTFTHIAVYNNYQCSDIVKLSDIRLVEGKWHVNRFHDMVKNPNDPILNADMSINQSNIATSKPWFKKGDFRNNYHVIRVINDTGTRDSFMEIYLNALDVNQRVSLR